MLQLLTTTEPSTAPRGVWGRLEPEAQAQERLPVLVHFCELQTCERAPPVAPLPPRPIECEFRAADAGSVTAAAAGVQSNSRREGFRTGRLL